MIPDEISKQLARETVKKTEQVIRDAVTKHLGRDDWMDSEILSRMTRHRWRNGEDDYSDEFRIDGVPLLLVFPPRMSVSTKGNTTTLQVSRDFKQL